ncbi:MAG: hypothetical protein P9L93_00785 [Candidatus Gorgyraea atricola]|nr:hypothetical protein [Candidatus Gorgyraea atricola]
MKSLIRITIVIVGVIFLSHYAYPAQSQRLSDAELDQIIAGKPGPQGLVEMVENMTDGLTSGLMGLVDIGTLANINEVDSATLVQSNMNVCTGDMCKAIPPNLNEATVINEMGTTANTLNLSGNSQSELIALANINAVNSATVVQSNFNVNVESATNTNTATVINSR